jgi:hypothetical protein
VPDYSASRLIVLAILLLMLRVLPLELLLRWILVLLLISLRVTLLELLGELRGKWGRLLLSS